MFENKEIKINVSDYLKLSAVTAVILQTVLSFALANTTDPQSATFIGAIYVLVKYTAPAFIFAIVYNMVKTNKSTSYGHFLKEKFFELVIPYLLWTITYLLFFPGVQQKVPYDSAGSFLLKFITGNAAPHLWYTIMMLQIQLLIPFFIWLGYRIFKEKRLVFPVLFGATALYVVWYIFYNRMIFNGTFQDSLYLADRVVVSFLIYGIYGAAAFTYHQELFSFLKKVRYFMIPVGFLLANVAISQFFQKDGVISLASSTYLNTSQSLYSLFIIMVVFYLASTRIQKNVPNLRIVKWLSTYAYRTYLANVFVFQVLLLLFKDYWLQLPSGLMIILAYATTVVCAFCLSYLLAMVWAKIKALLTQAPVTKTVK